MAKITQDLVRKRAEHNEGAIGSLEELSLHMLNIEKIEHLNNWCRELKILLLQNNIIAKIENLNRLKKLEYLNLSLNIVEKIENLEGCESLNRLDLTLNFIGELTSVQNLRNNDNLKTLTLLGNPCAEFEGYRDYVIHMLPQLEELDNKRIERSERIIAAQKIHQNLEKSIMHQENKYKVFRDIQRTTAPLSFEQRMEEVNGKDEITEEEILKKIWSEKSDNSPESRILMAKLSLKQQELKEKANVIQHYSKKPPRNLYKKDGKPFNINEPQLSFTMTEEDYCLILKLKLSKSLDTSDMTTDVHPDHVRVVIKGHIFQLCLLEEVKPDVSKAERSLSTGCLVITMPLVREYFIQSGKSKTNNTINQNDNKAKQLKRQMLEIGPIDSDMDFSRIVKYPEDTQELVVDDPDVPPLEEDET